jgi:hypothetical protein
VCVCVCVHVHVCVHIHNILLVVTYTDANMAITKTFIDDRQSLYRF